VTRVESQRHRKKNVCVCMCVCGGGGVVYTLTHKTSFKNLRTHIGALNGKQLDEFPEDYANKKHSGQ